MSQERESDQNTEEKETRILVFAERAKNHGPWNAFHYEDSQEKTLLERTEGSRDLWESD
jgi:hypothetical protein